MSVLPDFEHHRASSLDEALALVSFDNPPYSGGTELLLAMRAGLLRPEGLVDLKRIDELGAIGIADDRFDIGGAVTHQRAIEDPRVREHLPTLAATLEKVGNPRVRAAGTLGGNLCFAEPKSDVASVLIALEAEVELRSSVGTRSLLVSEFVLGPYTTAREDDEILTSIRIPRRRGRPAAYVKYQTMERPTIGVAAAMTAAGRCRVVVGAVGGTPEMFESADPSGIDGAEIASAVEVIPDLTGSERYKRHVVSVYVAKALQEMNQAHA